MKVIFSVIGFGSLLLWQVTVTGAVTNPGAIQWYREPFRITAGGEPLDTAAASEREAKTGAGPLIDCGGHAAPFMVDLDGFGRRDLVVGGIFGKFRRYHNHGTNAAPLFDRDYSYLLSDGKPAEVPMWCCLGSQPFFADVYGKHVLDFICGSYSPPGIFLFPRASYHSGSHNMRGEYDARKMLLDNTGFPLLPHRAEYSDEDVLAIKNSKVLRENLDPAGEFDMMSMSKGWYEPYIQANKERLLDAYNKNSWSTVAMVDWYNDGKLDVLIGTSDGKVFLVGNKGTREQPVWSSSPEEIRVGGEKAIPGYKASVTVADWDGDGLFDLVIGAADGSVWLLRNSGKLGVPEFKSRELLIGPGEECLDHFPALTEWLERGESPRRGGNAQIQVVDYNGDGKPDILVGDYSITMTPRTDLLPEEEKQMRKIRGQMDAMLQKLVGSGDIVDAFVKMSDQDKKDLDHLQKTLAPYLQKYDSYQGLDYTQMHGFVWVFLHK